MTPIRPALFAAGIPSEWRNGLARPEMIERVLGGPLATMYQTRPAVFESCGTVWRFPGAVTVSAVVQSPTPSSVILSRPDPIAL